MTLYIAIDGIDNDDLTDAEARTVTSYVHELMTEDTGLDVEGVGLVTDIENEMEKVCIEREPLEQMVSSLEYSIEHSTMDIEQEKEWNEILVKGYNALHEEDEDE